MNVLAVTSSYPKFEGDPTAPFIESITRHVAARGHSIHLVLPEHHEWNRPPAEGDIHYHAYRYSPRRTWTPWGYSESLAAGVRIRRPLYALAPLVFLSGVRACRTLMSRESIDVVHAHWAIPNGVIAATAVRGRGVPLVISLHGSDVSVSQGSRWIGALARWSFERAAAVTAPSEDLLDRARGLGARGLLELIPYGSDPDSFEADPATGHRIRKDLGLADGEVAVLGMGRFVHWKGFEYLIEAIARARARVPALRLVLVGDGDLRGALAAQVTGLDLDECVTFVGMVRRDDVPAYLAASDVVAVPSVHYQGYVDGLPNVALEAMAAGKPLIATRVGGLPQLVRNGDTGLLVDERDPGALAEALVVLATDSELRRNIGARGQAHVRESMSWNAVAERFGSVYDRVAKGRKR